MLKSSPTRRLTVFYLITLISVILLSVTMQIIFQWAFQQQRHDALMISVANREMVLSQQISKDVVFLAYSPDAAARTKTQQELQSAFTAWKQMYEGLQHGDAKLGLSGKNSTQVQALYQSIQPDFMLISQATQVVLSLVALDTNKAGDAATIQNNMQKIFMHENTFYFGMNTIIGGYQSEAEMQSSIVSIVELALLAVMFILLIGEALFVFRPATSALKRMVNEIAAFEQSITQQKQDLGTAIDKILQTHDTIPASNFQARWQLSYSLNNLLARFNSLLQIEANAEKFQKEAKQTIIPSQADGISFANNYALIQKDIIRLVGVMREAKTKKHPMPVVGSSTMVAPIYQELGGNYISSSPPSKKREKKQKN